MTIKSLGKWKLPQPLDIKEDVEWWKKRRKIDKKNNRKII